jgi:acylphosphatase
MKRHFDIFVSGKVQGVYYRAYTLEEAKRLGLTGFVQNLPDGRVYIEVEGEEEVLEKFIQWCWKGSPLSKVTNVECIEGPLKGYTSFTIKR